MAGCLAPAAGGAVAFAADSSYSQETPLSEEEVNALLESGEGVFVNADGSAIGEDK